MTPVRIQRKRTKGWRMPEGAVYVGRPSRWGNPYRPGEGLSTAATIEYFRRYAKARAADDPTWLVRLRRSDLVCWCPLDQPCHADVLLELANR